MQQPLSQPNRATGLVTIENSVRLPDPCIAPNETTAVPTARYHWRPSPGIGTELPAGFCLSLDCHHGDDNLRRFAPTAGVENFIVSAALGSNVLLSRFKEMSREQRYSYHAMRLIYQLAPWFREHFVRRFKIESDLHIPQAGRLDAAHVLPNHLGLDRQGRGNPWTPSMLLEHGRNDAARAGTSKPDTATCIRFGLLAAARRNPLVLDHVEDSISVVRLGLFDLGPASGPATEAQIERVQERLLTAFESHLDDDTETFNRWFFENFDSVVHGIEKKKRPGGPISRGVVRQALLETVFRAYRYVGDCVHVQMRDFLERVPEPLSAAERAIFDPIYLRQPLVGNLPLVLLHDRFEFLREILLGIFENPSDDQRKGVLLRLLQYYGEMANAKRQGDRRYKTQRHHRNDENRSAMVVALDPNAREPVAPGVGRFQEIAGRCRETQQAACPCGATGRWRAELVAEKTMKKIIVVRDMCEECGHAQERRIPRRQFKTVGRALLDEDERDRP